MLIQAPMRTTDAHGSGWFGAPRGRRKHRGIDFACHPGSAVLCLVDGTVTKLGYAYADDLSYRYVEITDTAGFAARYFYVEPHHKAGGAVLAGEIIGTVQPLGPRYPGITEHVHFEVRNPAGDIIDPAGYIQPADMQVRLSAVDNLRRSSGESA